MPHISEGQLDNLSNTVLAPIIETIFDLCNKDGDLVITVIEKVCSSGVSTFALDDIIKAIKKINAEAGAGLAQLHKLAHPQVDELNWFFQLGDKDTNISDFRGLFHTLIGNIIREIRAKKHPAQKDDTPCKYPLSITEINKFLETMEYDHRGMAAFYASENQILRGTITELEDKLEQRESSSEDYEFVLDMVHKQFPFMLLENIKNFKQASTTNNKYLSLNKIKKLIEVAQKNRKNHEYVNIKISGADFSNMDLTGVDFSGFSLENCNFTNAILTRCDFTEANLSMSTFTKATLHDVVLIKTNLSNSNLIEANFLIDDPNDVIDVALEGAKLDKQVIEQFADLIRIDFNKPIFELDRLNFVGQDLTGANLSNLYLTHVNFSSAIISGANFTNSDIRGSDFRKVTGLTLEMLHSSSDYTNIKLSPENQLTRSVAKKAHGNMLMSSFVQFKRKAGEDEEDTDKQLKTRKLGSTSN